MALLKSFKLPAFNCLFFNCCSAVLVLQDLTAAFNTVDHNILLSHVDQCVGIKVPPKMVSVLLLRPEFLCPAGPVFFSHQPAKLWGASGLSFGPLTFFPHYTCFLWGPFYEVQCLFSLFCS